MINAIGKTFKMKEILTMYEGRAQEFYRLKLKSLQRDMSLAKITKPQYQQSALEVIVMLAKIDKLTTEEIALQNELENKSLGELESADSSIKKIITKKA